MQRFFVKLGSSSVSSSTILCSLLTSLLFQISQAAITLPVNVTVPAVLVFGDSIVDPGNNNNLATLIKSNYHPYGRDFMGGIPTGRFSNGKIPSDLLVKELGIKDLLPAYLDPMLSPQELLTGISFASSGAGYDPLTAKIASVLSLSDQLDLFKEYARKLKTIVGEKRSRTILSQSIYIVCSGSDDIANTYFPTPFRRLKYSVPAYTNLMVRSASTFVRELYGLGARRIGLFSAPPIGCVPSQRTIAGGKHRRCANKYNQAAMLFNSKLSSRLKSLNKKLPQARLVYIDIYSPLLHLIQNPRTYGFKEVANGCCGTGKIEVSYLCNDLNPFTCKNVSNYIFWDSYHPTEKAYKILVSSLLRKYSSSFF